MPVSAPSVNEQTQSIAAHLSTLIDELSEENIIDVEQESEFRYTAYLSWNGFTGDTERPRGIDGFDLKDIEKDFTIRFVGACVRDTPFGQQPCLAITVDLPANMTHS